MRYRELRPSPLLARLVECYWTVRGNAGKGAGAPRRVLPDGAMDLLFSFGSPPGDGAGPLRRPSRFVVGVMTRAIVVRHAGAVDLLGVRFLPGGAVPFVDLPAGRIRDGHLPLDDLWGPAAASLWERLGAVEASSPRTRDDERRLILDEVLARRLSRTRRPSDPPVLAAAARLREAGGPVPVERLQHLTGLGRRQLERRFGSAVGLPPGTLGRILRFRRTTELLLERPERSLATVAVAGGYHDQPHMNRDFRSLAGLTPGDYRTAWRTRERHDASVQDHRAAAD